MPIAACVMMQKDEITFLEPWLAYHGHLFGFENLYVLDNGSTTPHVREVLIRYAAKGVSIDYSRATRQDYINKGDLVGEIIRRLDADRKYDFFFPTDCDEFIIKRTEWGFTCDRTAIHDYLDTLRNEQRVLRIPFQIANHPLVPDFYSYFTFYKAFFAAGTFVWTDHGHHAGESRIGQGFRDTQIIHMHFHYHPFAKYLELAHRKWHGSVRTDDHDQLTNYQGPSMHLAPYFMMTPEQYYAQFNTKVLFHMPQLRALLHTLGAPLELPREKDFPHAMPDLGERTATTIYVPLQFNEQSYLEANPDVRDSGLNGLYHFVTFGVNEKRQLPPQDAENSAVHASVQDGASDAPPDPVSSNGPADDSI